MKKLILSTIIFTALSMGVNAQDVTIPDANFKAYLVGNTAINTNSDTEIQVSEATAFSGTISCNSLSISDLTGIEAFTALTELSCVLNSLTTLNLSANGSLHWLSCGANQLTILNVANGNNANFTYFHAASNPDLTCVQVDNENYSTFNWPNIDAGVSYSTDCNYLCNVNIPDANFKAYLVGNSAINTNADTEIQCSEASAFTGTIDCFNLSVTDLTGIEAFTALTNLNCGLNSLNSLDVSSNTALTTLYCNYTTISNLDVSANTALLSLRCNNNTLSHWTCLPIQPSQSLYAMQIYLPIWMFRLTLI